MELSGGRNYEIAATPGNRCRSPAARISIRGARAHRWPRFSRRPAAQPDAVRLSGAVFERPGAGQSGNEERHKLRAHGFVYTAGILVSFWALVALLLGLRAAGATLGWGFQFQSPVFLSLMAGVAVLSRPFAGRPIRNRPHAHQRGRFAGRETGLRGQLLHRSARRGCRHAVHGAVYGSGDRLCACSTCRRHLRRVHGARSWPCRALCRAHAAAGVDAPAAQARRVDGYSEAGCFGADFWNGHLAGVGGCAGIRSSAACRAASSFLLLAIAGWFLGRWPAKRWATAVAAVILLVVVAACVIAPKKFGAAPSSARRRLVRRRCRSQHVAAMVCRRRSACSRRGPARLCGFHGELVSELPGERARCS